MKLPEVSILILNYNGIKDTLSCLKSLLKTNYPNFEIFKVQKTTAEANSNFRVSAYRCLRIDFYQIFTSCLDLHSCNKWWFVWVFYPSFTKKYLWCFCSSNHIRTAGWIFWIYYDKKILINQGSSSWHAWCITRPFHRPSQVQGDSPCNVAPG